MTRRAKGGLVLEDGPCAGTYSTRRAPYFLRAVAGRTDGHTDVLDQLHDEPLPREAVYVYEAIPGTLWDPSRLPAGTIVCPPPGARGRYRHRPDVDGATLRDTAAWRAWCRAQPTGQALVDGETGEPHPGLGVFA